MASLPSGTVTFLFTDIEDSTTLWQRHPEMMPAALARHHSILQSAIEEHNGHIFQIVGDAFCVAFSRATDALAAAIQAQAQLANSVFDTDSAHALTPPVRMEPLKVRMGIHTGAAELNVENVRAGQYASGITLSRAQRIMSAGRGGQVLISSATESLVRDQLPEGVTLRELGTFRLKGLLGLERLYQVVGPGLSTEPALISSLDGIPNNLPLALTRFIGREREIAEIKRLLTNVRLVTLTGAGGTGKTRLGLQVATDVLDLFPDGVWLVELAQLSNPVLIPQAVASTLDVRESQGWPLLEALNDYLRTKNLLLILDNCEHLIDACARLADSLLHTCRSMKIVASSREPLGVAGESVFRVPSLSLPATDASPADLLQSESARLFVERASSVQPQFTVTPQNTRALVEVCRRLDGIPLALELAASRVNLFTVEQIAERLSDRFRLLTEGSRTALPRQQTLRAAIDWSYDLLSDAERELLRGLSVFSNGWDYEAAESVCGEVGLEVIEVLSHLADKSLVMVDEQGVAARYRLLETVRQYARDKLLESGESPAMRDRHLQHYLNVAGIAEPRLEGPEILQTLNMLDTELDNLRTALEWSLEREPEAALQLAVRLTNFWIRRGHLTEGYRWVRDCAARFDALPPLDGQAARHRSALRARARYALGTLAFGLGDLRAGQSNLEEAVALAREYGETKTLARALGLLGTSGVWMGDVAATEAMVKEGMRIARAENDKMGLMMILGVQVELAVRFRHDLAAAQSYTEEGMRLAREMGDPWMTSMSMSALAELASLQGNYAKALEHLKEGERLFRQLGDQLMVNVAQSEQAHMERQQGHYPQALRLYAQTLLGWQELGHRAAAAHELECFAFIACSQSQPDRAARLFGAAASLRESDNLPMREYERIEYDQNLSALRAQMDEPSLAASWAEGRAMTMEQAIAYALKGSET